VPAATAAAAGTEAAAPAGRVAALDIARTVALAGMVVFHLVVDLELFGHLPPGTTLSGPWPAFARTVAGSFLFLAGVSLWLAHGHGIRWRPFLRRLAVLAAAAGGITLVTWLAMPDRVVVFGILHSIAVASVLGLATLRLPAALTLGLAALALAAPLVLRAPLLEAPWLVWLGLASWVPRSMDFVPVFPWLGACLAGIAAARFAEGAGAWQALRAAPPPGPVARTLAWPGRHSLAVYLLHQPVLLALIWAAGALRG
jgi:uncharacterized membrane protein